jgi:hypothetical protein
MLAASPLVEQKNLPKEDFPPKLAMIKTIELKSRQWTRFSPLASSLAADYLAGRRPSRYRAEFICGLPGPSAVHTSPSWLFTIPGWLPIHFPRLQGVDPAQSLLRV